MLAVEVNFLTGRFVATAHHDRGTTEWPPHPARFFSALVATWADSDYPDSAERRALEWLEKQPAPAIHAPEAVARKVVSHFVPVNDASVITRSSYENRYRKIQELTHEIKSHKKGMDATRSNDVKKLGTLENRLNKLRDVSAIVNSVGTTAVASAVDLMPPGWVSHFKRKGETHVRTGQARSYPSVTPDSPRITFIWNLTPPSDLGEALDRLLERVTRLGHSSSLVSCRLRPDPPPPTHIPGSGGTVLRAVRQGQLAALEREHAKHQAIRPRSLPFISVSYRSTSTISNEQQRLRPDTAGEMLIFQFEPKSRRIPSTRTAELASALRASLFRYAQDPLPEGLSGHQRNGVPSTNPHVGFLGLPWVEQRHSDGRLMGLAISIPHSLDHDSRRTLLRAVGTWEKQADTSESALKLMLGRGGILNLHRVVGVSDLVTLRPWVWQRPARRWISVMPIALPRHPGPLSKGTAAARAKAWQRAEHAVIDSCRHIGLPTPVDVTLSLEPFMPGARPAQYYPAFRQGLLRGKPVARRLVHASVTFDRPVEGPLVLGAGRYLGLGLMRPARQGNNQ